LFSPFLTRDKLIDQFLPPIFSVFPLKDGDPINELLHLLFDNKLSFSGVVAINRENRIGGLIPVVLEKRVTKWNEGTLVIGW
jgi:hypothetical protein